LRAYTGEYPIPPAGCEPAEAPRSNTANPRNPPENIVRTSGGEDRGALHYNKFDILFGVSVDTAGLPEGFRSRSQGVLGIQSRGFEIVGISEGA
jgi:hypothetical protein